MPPRITFVLFALAACGRGEDGTDVSINATGDNGSFVAGMDGKTGQVAIDLPGFSGKIKLPKIRLDADDFDLNGVHLFPGSAIRGMNIDANGDGEDGVVRVAFDSPAAPGRVRDWFLDKLSREAGFKVQASGTGITGRTDEDKPFRLDLTPDGADKAKGTIVLGG